VALSIAAARFLGPSEFGRQSFIAFVALSLHLLLTSGIALTLMRSVAETLGAGQPDQTRAFVAWAWRLQTVGALVGGAALVIVAAAGAEPPAAWAFAGAFVTLGVLQSVANAVLLGAQDYRAPAVIGLVTGGLTVPATIAVLAAGGGITGIFAVEAVVAGGNLVWAALLARRVVPPATGRARVNPARRRAAMRFAGWTTLSALVTLVVWRRSEFVFLAHYSSDAEIGLYSIGFATASAISSLPERVSVVLVPAFATLSGAAAVDRISSGYSRSLRLLISVTLPLAAGAAAVGPALVGVVYGDEFREAGTVLAILAIVIPFVAVTSVASALLSGLHDARTPLLAGLLAALVNVGLAFALIPPLDAVGAALANAGAQVAATFALCLAARRRTGAIDWRVASLLRTAVAAAGCGLASWGVLQLIDGAAGVVLAVAAGVIAFTALALALRALSADDAAWLDDALGHRLGGRVGPLVRRAGAAA
jgi:O-antigen/teichoic acid export membrane protein